MIVASAASTDIATSTEPIVTVFEEPEPSASLICETIVSSSPGRTDAELSVAPDASRALKLNTLGDFISIPVTGSPSAICS